MRTINCAVCDIKITAMSSRHLYCKSCRKKKHVEWTKLWRHRHPGYNPPSRRLWKLRNPEKDRECKARWKKNNPDKVNAEFRRRRARNPEKFREAYKKWALANPEKVREADLRWRLKNPEKVRKYVRDRRARRNNVVHAFTQAEWHAKLHATGGYCPICNQHIGLQKLTLDHIIPISKAERGRVYTIDDVQPLCYSCNSSKGGRI